MTGKTIAQRYFLEEQLGAGGMGTVYSGTDNHNGAKVAIKKLKPQISSPELIERFKREGEALRSLRHPNIVQLLDTVEENSEYFLVMEYVAGGDLSQKLKDGALNLNELLSIALDLCDALTRAHKLDIIHRDLKPANILIAEDGTVRLSDFGVAYFGDKERMTLEDNLIGTLDYLAPELFQGNTVDKRADIWAVGVILFEMLTGQSPFSGDSIGQILNHILKDNIPDIEALSPHAPLALVDLIYRILTRNPDERIPSIRLIAAELEALLNNTPLNFSIPIAFITEETRPDGPITEPPSGKHNLLQPTTAFVGREQDLSTIVNLLRDSKTRLLTVIAQGGMGKTRLTIEAGYALLKEYPQGVYFVELAPLASPEDIPSAIAEAVGYPFQGGTSREKQMINYFQDKHCLLILDNFEHLLPGREFVQAILQASPSQILVSSRERLNLSSEVLYHLEGMDFPDWESPADAMKYTAIRLLAESARRIRSDFVFEADDLPFAAHICRLVQGLPLGIVLAASWLDALTLKEIAEEIADNVDFLESTLHDLPERQRSIRAVFDYSWKMLTEDEKQAFARLSVFRGGMSREAAQAVSETNLRSLQTLVNKSLLRRDNATGRFEFHELLRQYGEEFLQEQGLLESIQTKHSAYYADYMAKQESAIKGQRQIAALSELDAEFENIKVAWRFACQGQDTETLMPMIEPIYWYCNFRNRIAEGRELFQIARADWHDDSAIAGRLLVRFPAAAPDYTATYERGLEIARSYSDEHEIAFCLRQLGHWMSHTLERPEGIDYMKQSAVIYERLDEKFCLAIVLDDLGWSYRSTGQLKLQLEVVQRSLDLRREIGDKIGMSNALRNMGGALGGMGSGVSEPLYKWLEALQLSKEIGDQPNIAWNSYMVSIFWQYEGELEKALPYRTEAFEIASEIKENTVLGVCLLSDALDLILIAEDYEQAKRLVVQGFPPNSPHDFRYMVYTMCYTFLAVIDEDYEILKQAAHEVYSMGKDRGHPMIAMAIFLGSVFLVRDSQLELAAQWLGLGEQTPLYRMGRRWTWYQRFRADLVAKVGETAFAVPNGTNIHQRMMELAGQAIDYIDSHS